MVSQHRNPRLFLLGGALEYQKTPNKLASLDTVLEQVTLVKINLMLSTCHIIKDFYKASLFLSFYYFLLILEQAPMIFKMSNESVVSCRKLQLIILFLTNFLIKLLSYLARSVKVNINFN
jgi:hypothetical protein